MALPSYDIDSITNIVVPNPALFNRNSSGVVTSSTPVVSSVSMYELTSQNLGFTILRQDIIIPNGSFTDPNVTTSAPNGTFASTPTHNRVIVNGQAAYHSTFVTSANVTLSSIRVPQTFVALGSASGASGNGMYSHGFGYIYTYQPGYLQQPLNSSSVQESYNINFTFPIYLRSNRWSTFGITDPVNEIIKEVARQVRSRYIPRFRVDLLNV